MVYHKNTFAKNGAPRAILHVDGDGFFAGCEVAKDHRLIGKPVVVGRERGMALAMTYEAKARGVKRGMTLKEAKAVCPDAIFLDADHESYALFSGRMNNIIARYTPLLERYSIDESFADLSGMHLPSHEAYRTVAQEIKATLRRELGMTFSLGIAPTKVLAKVGSKFKKPDGLTIIPSGNMPAFLTQVQIGDVWGIGHQTTALLEQYGIVTAQDFADKTEIWVGSRLAKPYREIWHELRGKSVLPLHTEVRAPEQSLMRSRTFTPPRSDKAFLLAELSRHTEVVCARAREHGLSGATFSFFLKTQQFTYRGLSFTLERATNIPEALIAVIATHIDRVHETGTAYRAAGVTLAALTEKRATQLDLFDTTARIERLEKIYEEVDDINKRFGAPLVHLAGSTHMRKVAKTLHADRETLLFARTGIPCLGTIS